ncbi:MAG: N-acetylmuramoyl-L-alanine amidase [Magnetospirillum sp.]|nr:MAG: N-acetylmuramoyl-L-alanine amidase [Magnetospirillum sp.]
MTPIPHPSPNFEPRHGSVIDMLVLHYTGMADGPSALARLCDPEAKVSAHYLIEEDGRVFALVPEEMRAWHAGASSWRGETDINSRSIGIELVNPGHEFGYRAFPEPQMAALVEMATDIIGRHPVPARNVVGHSDIAPTRKQDPGELFPWKDLAEGHGIGLWPCGEPADLPPEHVLLAGLAHIGYDIYDPKAALTAFQRHFRPWKVDGHLDAETVGRLRALLRVLR